MPHEPDPRGRWYEGIGATPCKPALSLPNAPPDQECNAAYTRLLREAERYALVVQAYGGVATLAIPEEQRKAGIRGNALAAACLRESECNPASNSEHCP